MTRIAHVSMKLVIGLRFSNGWAELALKKPPPFVPSCLIAIWLATGPPGMDCVTSGGDGAVERRGVGEAAEVLHDAAERQQDGDDERQRQEDPQRRAGQVDPEVAERAPAAPDDAADDRDDHGHAGGGGHEVLHRQAEHLGEVAHRRARGLYHCQFVLVMKLTAALNAPSGATPGMFVGLNSRPPWNRSRA